MDVSVRHEPEQNRHVAVDTATGRQVGMLVDHVADGHHLLVHTEVAEDVGGMGVASSLVRQVLDAVRDEGGRIEPRCPFVRGFLDRNPEYRSLVVDDLRGVPDRGERAG